MTDASTTSRPLFNRQQLISLFLPLVAEQALSISIGLADTLMVSSVGEAAVSGVSLVDSFNVLMIQLLSALATGGAVVASQYIGHREPKRAKASAAQADTPVAAPKPAEGKKTKEQKRAEAQARAALNKKLKGVRNQLKKIETELDKKRARYDELMELMASEELYADQDKFNAALGEYNGLKQELPKLEDEWLELSTQIEEETARELS